MLITIARVLATLFAVLVVSKSYLSVRQRRESPLMFILWLITWAIILVLTYYPQIINTVLGREKVGVGTVLGVGLVFVYFVLYRVYAKADRVEKELHRLTRELAIKDTKESTDPKS